MRARQVASFALLLVACGSTEPSSSSSEAVIGGKPSGSDDDEVVLVLAHDASKDTAQSQWFERCTGTLLAPNVVLTARHCVSATSDGLFTCAENGTLQSGTGGVVGADFPPGETYVYVGATLPPTIDPTKFQGIGSAFVHDAASVTCNDDVALIVLAAPIPSAKIAPIRLTGAVTVGETLSVIGWGATLTSFFPSQRQRRDGVTVVDVGPSPTQRIGGQLADHELLASESICIGDSGGPVFDATSGAVVGVVSRGSSGTSTQNGSGCVGTEHTVSQTASFASLVQAAFAQAGGGPWIEGQPEPGTTPDADAGADAEADASDEDGGPTTPNGGGGCALGGGPSSSSSAWLLALGCAVLVRRRRVS